MGDFDPYGLEIYLNYCFGNSKTCYENFNLSEMKFIGIDGVSIFESSDQLVDQFQSVELTIEDLDKIERMLDSGYMDDMVEWCFKREIFEENELNSENSKYSTSTLDSSIFSESQNGDFMSCSQKIIYTTREMLVAMRFHNKKIEVEALLFGDNCPISYIYENILSQYIDLDDNSVFTFIPMEERLDLDTQNDFIHENCEQAIMQGFNNEAIGYFGGYGGQQY